ncbi:hypothetical protein JQN72_17775 [Phycicoccus sp. CSK15P-2]|uniref:YncE family protein n=1 Tax=Phycicoccus sp. CSK15P-2 TaxID=2807627 RepID=UPI00194FE1FF|nr:hypothetical protein [Phycicoccus sp. CSK15P-2]MBM6406085.1 hypothetical protein [Phycicoccus sp. CSK15P-2]
MTSPRLPRRTLVAGLPAVALAGCSAGDGAQTSAAPGSSPEDDLGGAEPAEAPEPSADPAGIVAEAGYAAEGLVYDPPTGLLAVGVRRPDRVLVLDPESLVVRRSVQVAGTVRHLGRTGRGGTVLVPNEADDTLLEVDLRTGGTRSTPVGHVPHDAAGTTDGELLVADEFGGSLTVVRDGEVVHTFEDLEQPGGVVAAGRLALVVDVGAFTVTSYDLDRLERVARLPAGDGPTHGVLPAEGRLAVSDTRGERLLLYSVDPLEQVGEIALPGSPYGLAGDTEAGLAWVTLTALNEVVGVDATGDTPREVARHPTVRQPNTVAAEPGSSTIWVASRTDGVVQRIPR